MRIAPTLALGALALGALLALTLPTLAEASTPFLEARGKEERCEALEGWYAELLERSEPGLESMRMGPKLRQNAAQAFQDDVFVEAFGASFFGLSDRDKKKIHKALGDCFEGNSFVRSFIARPFSYRERSQRGHSYKRWIEEIERMRREGPSENLVAERRRRADQEFQGLPAAAGEEAPVSNRAVREKVLSTRVFRAYRGFGCDLFVMLRDPAHPLGEPLETLAQRELIPAVLALPNCPPAKRRTGTVNFYFDEATFEIYNRPGAQRGSGDTDVRHLERREDLTLSFEVPAFQIYFSGPDGGPYHLDANYFDQLAFDFVYSYDGDPTLDSLADILAYVADPGAQAAFVADLNASRAAAREGRRQEAEERRQQELAEERVVQRRQAAPVLALLRGLSSPPPVDFSAANYPTLLTRVYSGEFEPFTGDHSPGGTFGDVWNLASAFGAMVGNRNWEREAEKMKYHQQRIEDFARRRTPIKLAQKEYHEAYAAVCRQAPSASPWRQFTYQRDYIQRDRFGTEQRRFEGEAVTLEVRAPFAESFGDAYQFSRDPGFFAMTAVPEGMSTFSRRIRADFETFLRRAGCDAPEVRYFEVNLHLAYRWLPSAQELSP